MAALPRAGMARADQRCGGVRSGVFSKNNGVVFETSQKHFILMPWLGGIMVDYPYTECTSASVQGLGTSAFALSL